MKLFLTGLAVLAAFGLTGCDKVKQPDPKPTVSEKIGTASAPGMIRAGCKPPTEYVIKIKRANGVEAVRCMSAADYQGTLVGDVWNGEP